jgi:DNA-binding SARP family transcriptional activator/pimeloyl-ACP methyl ester carboxylesterase
VDFLLLGPLTARDADGRDVDLGGAKQRALLALLLLDTRRTVPIDRLIDELWGDDVPESARKMVQIHVSHLRRLLAPGMLETRPAGYAIDVAPEWTDLGRFEHMVAMGRHALAAGAAADAAARLADALALWRGPALEGLGEPFAVRERARLESLRLAALEDRIEADLARGAHGDLTAELDALVLAHPARERLRGQHMLALYRAGRQADALASYQAAYRHLEGELGIQPSRGLRELEQRILAQDEAIAPAPAPAIAPAATRPAAPPAGRAVRYAVNGDVSLAYQVFGEGPAELVLTTGWVLPMELFWDDLRFAAFLDRLGAAARVLIWDKRGTGLSERVSQASLPTNEDRVEDLLAVMDAAGFERPVMAGLSEGTHVALLLAAAHPERVRALALYGGWARTLRAIDHPAGDDEGEYRELIETVRDHWGDAAQLLRLWAPASQHDISLRAWWARALRLGATPTTAVLWLEMLGLVDLRDLLPSIRVPTVVVHRRGDVIVPVGNGRHLAAAIPGARYIELPGEDHLWWLGDRDAIIDPILELVGSREEEAVPDHVLATILAFAPAIEAAELVRRHGGRPLAPGAAAFEGPSRAVRCAAALRDAAAAGGGELGAGIQTGECARNGGHLTGPAVESAQLLAELAAPGEIIVTRTVVDLVAGSELRFGPAARPIVEGPAGLLELSVLSSG